MSRITVVIAVLLFAGSAQAGEAINQNIDADPDGTVDIEILRGSVTVLGWDKGSVHVEGTRDDHSEEFVIQRRGKVIRMEDELRSRVKGGQGTQITVNVPRGSRVRIETVSASITLRDIAGSVEAEAVSGNVDAADLGGEVALETISGNISLHGAAGEIELDAVSGSIDARTSSRKMEVESVSGHVEVHNSADIVEGEFATISGGVSVTTALSPGARVSLDSISGDITLSLDGEINAVFDAQTGPGGRIRNKLTDEAPERGRFAGEESLQLQIGDESADVTATVLSGTITLRRN